MKEKLDAKCMKLLFVGYSEKSKAYRLMNVATNSIIVSRHVVVDKKASFFSSNSDHREDEVDWFKVENLIQLQDTSMQEREHTIAGDVHKAHGDEGSSNTQEMVVGTADRPEWWYSLLEGGREDELSQLGSDDSSSGPKKSYTKKVIDYVNYALMSSIFNCFEPWTYDEAKGKDEWEIVTKVEYDALMKNKTWTLEELPPGKKPIGCKWVYKVKYKADDSLDKYKARLVAKGFPQREGVDFEEVFAPTKKMVTIRFIVAIVAQFKWRLYQMDVKSMFLNRDLEVYMDVTRFVAHSSNLVWKRKKALYELKQGPRA
eukprot:Gb_19106 [translate_table: standard]